VSEADYNETFKAESLSHVLLPLTFVTAFCSSLFTLLMALRVKDGDYFSTQYKQTDLSNGDVAYWETSTKSSYTI